MSNEKKITKKPKNINEDRVFKSLNHKIRRDIIRIIGNESKLTFTEIKKNIDSIDSPSLSYHLKSLVPLIKFEDNNKKYQLTDIGQSAYKLLLKTDQTKNLSRYKRRLLYAYLATLFFWNFIQFLIPYLLVLSGGIPENYYIIAITLGVASTINLIIVGFLKNVRKFE